MVLVVPVQEEGLVQALEQALKSWGTPVQVSNHSARQSTVQ